MSAAEPASRLIALGASNLTRGFLALLDAARASAGGPVEVFAALGRGRSYGVQSRLLGRALPGIDDCGLWDALVAAPPRPATALLMDVGNDILYGIDVATLLGWIDAALARLRPFAARRIVAGLPLGSIRRLGGRRFVLARSLLVPGCRLSLAEANTRAEQVDDGLRTIAARHGAEFRPLRDEWYGLDPVHIRRRLQPAAFTELLGAGPAAPTPRLDRAGNRLRFLLAKPARRSWFGRESIADQPAMRWPDGSQLALY